jgi:CBS domain-containing protein
MVKEWMEALVDSIMSKKPEAVDPDLTVSQAAEVITRQSEHCLIVTRGGMVVGIVTASDIIEKVVAVGANPAKVYVRDIMSTPVVKVDVTATTRQAAELMSEYGVRKLPVVDQSGALAGLVTSLELARWLAKINDFQDPALNALAKLKNDGQGGPYR